MVGRRRRCGSGLQIGDAGGRRAFGDRAPHPLDGLCIAVQRDLDAPVGQVSGVTGDTVLARPCAYKGAKADTLDAPANQNFQAAAVHGLLLSADKIVMSQFPRVAPDVGRDLGDRPSGRFLA